MKLEGAIFDVDGTLLDSMEMWATLGSRYLKSLGILPKEGLDNALKEMSISQGLEYIKKEYNVKLSNEKMSTLLDKFMEDYYKFEVDLKPHVRLFLELLRAKGIKMCIATATERKLIENAFDRLKISHFFEGIFTCTEVGFSKADPTIYRKSQEFLNIKKEKTIVFEDALHALKTAQNDGFKVVAVFDSYEQNQEELIREADVYLKDFDDLSLFWEYTSKL